MNELTTIIPHEVRPADNYRTSTDAAGVCREIVVATASNIQGRKFVSVEGWQAIAIAHGCAAGARDVERVEGGVRAIGEVRRMNDGQIIATAEGFVGEDEETWFGGQNKYGKTLPKRNDYAIRAMAQTRAISRACRSAFAHVVVMMNAGLSTTPAEEVPVGGFDNTPHDPQTGEIHEAPQKVPGISNIKKRLNKLMMDGNSATDLASFNALVGECKEELTAIKEANHDYWTGDGGDEHEGFKKWIVRRRAELTPPNASDLFRDLVDSLNQCDTQDALESLVDMRADSIADLDGEESRKFTKLFDYRSGVLKGGKVPLIPSEAK